MICPSNVIFSFLTFDWMGRILADVVIAEEEAKALHYLKMSVFRLSFERQLEVAEADGEVSHGVLWV